MNAPDHPDEILPWEELSSEPGVNLLIARQRTDHLLHPRTGRVFGRTVLEMPGWVNVVARTAATDEFPEGQLIVVRQWRFGRKRISLEIPGGVVDPGEEHFTAAVRELREETGYTSETWSLLGRVEPNPAFQDNVCYHWLAEDCQLTHELDLDEGEDIAVEAIPWPLVPAAVHTGTLVHSLVVSALSRVFDLRG